VSDERLRIMTDEQRARLHAARRWGTVCAACGRPLGGGETVYLERFQFGMRRLHGSGAMIRMSAVSAPVGSECASPEFLEQTAGTEPERCAGCARGVYYRRQRSTRRRALCSRRCSSRAAFARQAARAKGEG
jgi:hypothetical protein